MSNKSIAILGVVIILLLMTQFLFSPSITSTRQKYVSAEAKSGGSGSKKKPYQDLQYAIDHCKDGDTLIILPGVYEAGGSLLAEDLCGNCQDHRTLVNATRGFIIEGSSITIIGAGRDKTTLITNAGYGVLFLNCRSASIHNVSITGGRRDSDGNATDAGIVVKFSSVTIKNCRIADNIDQAEDVIVGIGGIFGREGSEVFAFNNEIVNNGWDGIALYRGSTGYIAGNIIRKGRGAGIGITWDASAIIIRNEISDYWKGIGSFGDSRVVVKNNIVHDCLGWGIIAAGSSYMDACNNVVYSIGNCGMAAWSEDASGRFCNNIVVKSGWKEQWVSPLAGLQNNGGMDNFIVCYNNIWNNQEANYGGMVDLTGQKGNISIDPLFRAADVGDFHLLKDSPCIDVGSPLITDEDGTVSDMGAYSGPGVSK